MRQRRPLYKERGPFIKKVVNVYAPNIIAPKYILQILTDIQGVISGNIKIVEDLITPANWYRRNAPYHNGGYI